MLPPCRQTRRAPSAVVGLPLAELAVPVERWSGEHAMPLTMSGKHGCDLKHGMCRMGAQSMVMLESEPEGWGVHSAIGDCGHDGEDAKGEYI